MQFLGAAGTVTGSKHLVRAGNRGVLLDCGLFQGPRELRERNWAAPPFACADLDAVVLSHAHIDHTGYLPAIVKHGFQGPVYCTPATADLLSVLLPDSAHLQEEEADRANRHGYSRHKPALPLYTMDDAAAALRLLVTRPYTTPFDAAEGVAITYRPAGHILGSATVEARMATGPAKAARTLVFSGDLGRWNRPIMPDPELVRVADTLLLESTYGDQSHPPGADARLAQIVGETAHRGGALLIPAFAVGRTQEVIWMLRQLEHDGRIPSLPVYVDSPMAIDVTAMYEAHREDHDPDMERLLERGGRPLVTQQFTLARSPEESKRLNDIRGPIIIISASGMATGGRIMHHLRLRLPDKRTTVLFVGYQGFGTNGRALQDGVKTVRLYGDEVTVRARIETLSGLSAHAGQDELLRWAGGFERPPGHTYLVHGEPEPAAALAKVLKSRLGWMVSVAKDRQTVPV